MTDVFLFYLSVYEFAELSVEGSFPSASSINFASKINLVHVYLRNYKMCDPLQNCKKCINLVIIDSLG